MKKFLFGAVAIAVAFTPLIRNTDIFAISTDLTITAINLGTNGDATLLESKGKYLLMDTGYKESTGTTNLFDYLDEHNVTTFDIYLSHFHSDHYGYINDILKKNRGNYTVENVYFPAYPDLLGGETIEDYAEDETLRTDYEKYFTNAKAALDKYASTGVNMIKLKKGDTMTLGDANIKIIGPDKDNCFFTVDDFKDEDGVGGNAMGHFLNNASLAARITVGKTVFLSLGDTEKREEQCLIDSGEDLNADIMKLSHHGGFTSNTDEFIKAVSPSYTWYSLNEGKDAQGNSVKNEIPRINEYTNVLSTGWNGNIVYTIHNDTINVTAEKNYRTATINYVDEKNGETIEQETVSLRDGWKYYLEDRTKRHIDDYEYSSTDKTATGTATGDIQITSYYKELETQGDPTEPTDPTDPTDPTEPTDPTDPTEPTEPTDPTDPTEPTDPTDPTEPTDPTDPTEPTDPTDPTEPTDPTDPTGPTEPTEPTNPTGPTEPTEPTDPTEPTEPTEPTNPTEPTDPSTPDSSKTDPTTTPTASTTKTNNIANPKTADNSHIAGAGIAGFAIITIVASLYLTKRR